MASLCGDDCMNQIIRKYRRISINESASDFNIGYGKKRCASDVRSKRKKSFFLMESVNLWTLWIRCN